MKKGSEFGIAIIVSLIILAVGIIFFYPFSQAIASFIKSGGDSAACVISLKGGGVVKCPTDEVKVFNDKVEINGKNFLERGNRETQNMAKEALAGLLVKCLNRGGGYNSNAFSAETYFDKEAVCLECSHFSIDDRAGKVEDFIGYLRDTKAGSVSDKKYLDALTKDKEHLKAYMDFGMISNLIPPKSSLKSKQDYTIFFIGLKRGYVLKLGNIVYDVVTLDPEALKLYLGYGDTYFTYIAESDRVGEVCDRLVN